MVLKFKIMKRLIYFLLVGIFYSCETQEMTEEIPEKKVRFHIYYADWDEWGRASKDCGGWGLCNYVDCWFCCEDEGVIVDCESGQKMGSSGKIKINEATKSGYLYIELDPTVQIENDAIVNQKDFFIDNDIVNTKTTLIKGVYKFDLGIGNSGGYKINAIEN